MRRKKARRKSALAAALALGLAAACAEPRADSDPWSRGARLVARTPSLVRLLEQLESSGEHRLARRAGELRASLPDCPALEATAGGAEPGELLASLHCRPPLSPADAPWRAPQPWDLAFALPLPGAGEAGARWRGALVLEGSGDAELELELPAGSFAAPRAWLFPGRAPAGPPRLARTGELLHLRLRPDAALDLASLVSADGQAARLFRLKSRLFAGAVLDGSWEVAAYPPARGQRMPLAALALGVAEPGAAVAAMEDFLRELRESWPVTRTPFSLGEAGGACLADLNLLPDLAPCYVATRDALVVGWNAPSLARALEPPTSSDAGAEANAVIELARFARPVAPAGRGGEAAARDALPRLPWRRLVARGELAGEQVRLHVRLEAGSAGA